MKMLKKIISAILILLMTCSYAVAASVTKFSDVPNSRQDSAAIMELANSNVVMGDGYRFYPDAPLTPNTVKCIVARALENQLFSNVSNRTCVPTQVWGYLGNSCDSVESSRAAAFLGVVAQYLIGASTFDPNMYYSDFTIVDNKNLLTSSEKTGLKEALHLGLISIDSKGNYHVATEPITRGEFCQMLVVLKHNISLNTSPAILEGIPTKIYGNNTEELNGNAVSYLYYLPKSLLDSFKNNGWSIYFVNGSMSMIIGDVMTDSGVKLSNAAGYTDYTHHVIAISVTSGKYILHEFGHFLQFQTNSTTVIIPTEDEALKTFSHRDYCETTSREYYAEAFMAYCMDSSYMENNCPQITAVIKKDIASVK